MTDTNKSFIDTAVEIAESVLPEVKSVLKDAMKTVGEVVSSDAEGDVDTAAVTTDDTGTPEASSSVVSRLLTVLVIGGLMAVAAVVIQRILKGRGEDSGDNWTSAYTPTPPDAETEAADEAVPVDAADEATEPATDPTEPEADEPSAKG